MRFLLAVLIVVLIIGIAASIDEPQNNGVYILIGVSLIWMIYRLYYRKPIFIPAFILPLIAYFALQSILVILGTHSPLALHWLNANLFYIILIILFTDVVKNLLKPSIWEDAFLILVVFICLLAYAETFVWLKAWWEISGNLSVPIGIPRPASFVSHPVSLAGIINIVWPIAFLRAWTAAYTRGKIVYVAVLAILFGGLYFSAARAAWGIAIAQIIIIIFLYFLSRVRTFAVQDFKLSLGNFSRWRILITSAVFLVCLPVISFVLFNRLISTGRSLTTLSGRAELWGIAWELIKSSPILGHGVGTFPMEYVSLMPKWQNALPLIPQASNFFLHTGAEMGIVGIGLILIVIGLAFRAACSTWKLYQHQEIESMRIIVYISIGLSIILHNQFEFLFSYGHNSVYAVIVIIFLALFFYFAPRSEFVSVSPVKVFPLILGILAIFAYVINGYWAGRDLYIAGWNYAEEGKWDLARDRICAAIEENPENAFTYFQCSFAYANLASEGDSESLNRAIAYQEMGLSLDPTLAINWANLAVLQLETDNFDEALFSIRHASEIESKSSRYRNPIIDFNQVRIEDQFGNKKAAFDAYNRVLTYDPWVEYSLLASEFNDLGETSKNIETKWGSELWIGWTSYLDGDHHDALKHLNNAIKNNPSGYLSYALLALVQNDLGDTKEAVVNIQKALFISQSPRILYFAGHIYRTNANYPEASNTLLESIDGTLYSYWTWHYYYFLYREKNTFAYSPYLKYGFLNESMIEDYVWLAEYQEKIGNLEKSREIRNWIQRNIPEPGND